MKPEVKKFFAENPEAKYYYIGNVARISNPDKCWMPDWEDEPWPDSRKLSEPQITEGKKSGTGGE